MSRILHTDACEWRTVQALLLVHCTHPLDRSAPSDVTGATAEIFECLFGIASHCTTSETAPACVRIANSALIDSRSALTGEWEGRIGRLLSAQSTSTTCSAVSSSACCHCRTTGRKTKDHLHRLPRRHVHRHVNDWLSSAAQLLQERSAKAIESLCRPVQGRRPPSACQHCLCIDDLARLSQLMAQCCEARSARLTPWWCEPLPLARAASREQGAITVSFLSLTRGPLMRKRSAARRGGAPCARCPASVRAHLRTDFTKASF